MIRLLADAGALLRSIAIEVWVGCWTFALHTLPRWRWAWRQIRAQREALSASRMREFRKAGSE